MRKPCSLFAAILVVALSLAACEGRETPGFSLPAGDEDAGSRAFVDLACNDCHAIAGRDDLRADQPSMTVPLGGPTSRIRTYSELVTSIINPSHRIAEAYQGEPFSAEGVSRMRSYNQVMTVQQLTDLTTFLESEYVLVPYPLTPYQRYHYP
jgi:hypothetical protein